MLLLSTFPMVMDEGRKISQVIKDTLTRKPIFLVELENGHYD
jgi:hypothetical protein